MEKHAVPLPSSSLSLSSIEYGNQFLNDNADMSLNEVLKDPVKDERLMKLEKKVVAMSKIDHTEAIKEFVQANMINEVKNQLPKFLPKAVSEYVQLRMERTIRDVLKKNPINLFQFSSTSADSLTEYELK
ncbi:hypothetical protein Tco_0252876 [Tanacetum coccineum]